MKKKLLFVLFAVLTLAMGATAATSSVIERTGKSIKKERTAPARQVAKANADKSPTVYRMAALCGACAERPAVWRLPLQCRRPIDGRRAVSV